MAPPDDNHDDPDAGPPGADDDRPPGSDRKVKDLLTGAPHELDATTRAELERWFGLPSFQQLTEEHREPEVEDPDIVASRTRREKALAAVDRAMVDAHFGRYEIDPESVIQFRAMIDVRVDPTVALLDLAMIDRQHSIAEPREVEIPQQLQDDLQDCTPQAILRDLHRPELDFQKYFEVVDFAAEQRVDGVALVAKAMATRWSPPFGPSSSAEGRAIFAEFHRDRRESIAKIVPHLLHRRVEE